MCLVTCKTFKNFIVIAKVQVYSPNTVVQEEETREGSPRDV